MTDLTEFGWCDFFAAHLADTQEEAPARVVAEHRTMYRVQTAQGEFPAVLAGRMRHQAEGRGDLPAVGDWVVVRRADFAAETTIARILPRRTKFSRKAAGERTEEQIVAANVDVVWIVSALENDLSLRRIERYLSLAWESGAQPVVVLTKADLCDQTRRRQAEVEEAAMGTSVHAVSSVTGQGLDDLRAYLGRHATIALLGSSGVGKSTLINAIAGATLQQTADVRQDDGKGRHTTTHRQLIRLPSGGLLIDTPGMRELQLWDADEGVEQTFGDIEASAVNCRFSDCQHAGEPGCAVAEAVEQGALSAERLASYHKLQRELAWLDRRHDARAQAEESRRWRQIHKSLRRHPKYKR